MGDAYIKGSLDYYEQLIREERNSHKEKMAFYQNEIEKIKEEALKDKRPNVYGEKTERNQKIISMYKNGYKKSEIAQFFGITSGVISSVIEREEQREKYKNLFPRLLSCETPLPFYVFNRLYRHVSGRINPKHKWYIKSEEPKKEVTEEDILDFIEEAEKTPELYANIHDFGNRYLSILRAWIKENKIYF